MQRRNARLRREYLYRKSLEAQDKTQFEKKRKLREALAEGKPIPSELRGEERELRKQIALDDVINDGAGGGVAAIDDEYARAGVQDPRIFITTSRNPSNKLMQFAKERFNRGQTGVPDLVEACRASDCTDLIVVHETRGEPDAMLISHMPYGPTACFGLVNVVTRHDVEETTHAPQVLPHLIFDKFDSKLGERVKSILKYLFPVPKADSTRVITFANRSDFISFRHHSFQLQPPADPLLKEIGPRFEMRLYQIRLGTLEQEHADTEFNLRPYVRKRGSYLEK